MVLGATGMEEEEEEKSPFYGTQKRKGLGNTRGQEMGPATVGETPNKKIH